ncbi:SEC-C metal-binding domain-containing protein [Thiohalomonas denitrificans]|uniref:SEC-C metal-binding domain-containing protein n=1 Tax=Thiohalomonas denitrificans TaxID=415747 RepID=UPI0026F12207|nr:SEC-C metal-binding domain-containing protein [Thiohalomonas denitrificans]
MFDPLDLRQVARIEAVHRGFLYQHLYAAACLLVAGWHGVRSVTIEFDEDIELELDNGDRVYVQVKTRSSPLIHSDIAGALDRFERLRLEHQKGRRSGGASLAIVANVAPGPELQERLDTGDLPAGVVLLTPEAKTAPAAYLPPAWTSVGDAINWCSDQARVIPMATLEPETLVWKLAGRALLAAAGQAPSHIFNTSDLPTLFEQLIVQLQQFPVPPEVYRPLEDEPALDGEARVRIISGHSGAGKTAWAAQAAQHLGSECAYYDVGDVPGPAIAASLVRELAAQWAAPSVGGLRQVLLPGSSGIESLRALDRFLGANATKALVVLDNAHRVPANDLRMLIEATQHLRIVLLAQPSQSIAELEATIGLQQEILRGWGLDQAAAEVHAQGARASATELGRLLTLTGGLPLYVRTAAQLSAAQYDGDVAAMCTAIEAHTNLVETAQESLLSRSFDALPESARNCATVLSLSDVPLSEEESAKLAKATFGLDAPALAAAVRTLEPIGIVRVYGARRLQIHDAFRVLGLRRYAEIAPSQATAGRHALKELILESFEKDSEYSRFPLFIRTLVELGELKPLVDIATEEWFHELGVNSGIWDALGAAASDEKIDPEQRFYALDGLVFTGMKSGDAANIDEQLRAMEALVAKHDLGPHEELVVLLKRMLFEANRGNEAATRQAMERAMAFAPNSSEHQRILRYNIAYALFQLGHHAEAEGIVRELVEEYFNLLGLTQQDIFGASNAKIAKLLRLSPTLHDDIKHLADSLDVLARVTNAQGRDSGLARVHAAKLYGMANALDSFVNVNQDLVDEFLGRGDCIGARQVIEEHLLPVVVEHKMLDRIVPVRSQYAVVLGYCGEYDAADAELDRLAPYRPGLTEHQRAEIDNQRGLVAQLRQIGIRPGMPEISRKRALRRIKVGRNEACPCGSGLKYKRCHGRS